ncbi:MAG: IS630 family transposase [Candidatus Rokubacteria bacterium]|nr:IS630 family transposase [Candidatus Rokubacteria bacterium]
MFLDESGFLLIPNVRKTWAPVGCTPTVRHSYKRDKLSAISAVSVSPQRARVGLYMHVHSENITGAEVMLFLRHLLRHLRGPVELLWDGGSIHKRADVKAFLRRHPKLIVHRFPAYAPELNPDEFVWTKMKHDLANGGPEDIRHLDAQLRRSFRRLHGSQQLLWSCILVSDLPWS